MTFNMLASWERLAPRERRLVAAAGAVFATMLSLIVIYLIYDGLSALEERNESMRDALGAIEKNRDEFMAARRLAAGQEMKISRVPLALVTLVENAAREVGISTDQTNEQPPQPHGKKYLQKGIEVKFRQVELPQLVRFMRQIETGPNLVYVSRLFVKPRFNEHSKLDVELNITAFEHAAEQPKKGKAAGSKPDAGAKGAEP